MLSHIGLHIAPIRPPKYEQSGRTSHRTPLESPERTQAPGPLELARLQARIKPRPFFSKSRPAKFQCPPSPLCRPYIRSAFLEIKGNTRFFSTKSARCAPLVRLLLLSDPCSWCGGTRKHPGHIPGLCSAHGSVAGLEQRGEEQRESPRGRCRWGPSGARCAPPGAAAAPL